MNKEIYNKLPKEVKDVLFLSEGWLVGSSVEKLLSGEQCRDYDILITDLKLYYKTISTFKGCYNNFTTFGGINLGVNEMVIDIWHDSLESFINMSLNTGTMYNMVKGHILKLEKI